jgi:hypothetical protein
LSLDLNHETQYGPGGSYASIDGAAHYRFGSDLTLTLSGGRLNRPLEFRFDEATLHFVAVDADWPLSERWRVTVSASRFMEDRDRPDAAAFDWSQTRLSARVSLLLGNEAGSLTLPPARRRERALP